jgi:hypothetical protein
MQYGTERKIGDIRDFKGLVQYLRDELDWPLDLDEIEDLTFEYEPDELGLKPDHAVKVKEIKQLRPVVDHQPWGIFWVEFENRALPVTVMRQILRALVYKKRATAKAADRKAWHLKDLIFMSSLGEKGSRRINFSYFRETGEGEPTLQTFFWDEQETQFYWLDKNHLERLRWPADTDDVEDWRRQWAGAFTAGYREPVRTARDLSERLAALAADTRDAVLDVLRYETSTGPLHRLFESFQIVLLHDLDEGGFADMVAQTIAYGLFSARCTGQEVLGLAHLEAMVPNTNRFLKELFAELAKISGHKKGQINFDDLGLSAMVALLRDKNIEAVLEEFGRQAGGGKEDPVIHFYETFLSVYDKQQKVQRGVFYTPKPVVTFIVRSVHEVLQKEFGLPDGLADTTTWGELAARVPGLVIPKEAKPSEPFVQILDPATGTGTFLEEVVDVVHQTMMAKWRAKSPSAMKEAWNEYVANHLLPRLRGFELMMAPYAVAHMKIGLKLRQTGYNFKSNERLRVFLTNTLESPEKGNRKLGFLPDFLSHESMQADAVKEHKAITVVIGNPPYSGHSANKGDWIYDLMRSRLRDGADSFFNVDGKPLGERNPKWLNDDYVKFLRYGQSRIASAGAGILGFITNHSYLDNPTFRGMRQSMWSTFGRVRLIDLHGNSKKKERAPGGGPDENVFDIQQGVAVGLFCREGSATKVQSVQQKDLWGTRDSKYEWLIGHSVSTAGLTALSPKSPGYLYIARTASVQEEYEKGISLPELFPISSVGIVTARDHLTIHWTPDQVWDTVKQFSRLEPEKARAVFELGPDAQDWKVALALDDIRSSGPKRENVVPILYRPFDKRYTYYTGQSRGFMCRPRPEVMKHFVAGPNLGIITSRQTKDEWSALITDSICGHKTCAAYDINTVFPLYVYDTESLLASRGPRGSSRRAPNISQLGVAMAKLAFKFDWQPEGASGRPNRFGPEDLLAYIYAILYSPSYRERYAELLKSEFARIPLTANQGLVLQLRDLGNQLLRCHLLQGPGIDEHKFPASGSGEVDRADFEAGTERIYVNSRQYFTGVTDEIWGYKVGGYQVCQKWLKDRRDMPLSDEEILNYRRILAAIRRTIALMQEVDEAIEQNGGWPI